MSSNCRKCGQLLVIGVTIKEWQVRNGEAICRDCSVARSKARILKNKITCLDFYGKSCACCGESEVSFLCIDHINGGGNSHRKEVFGTKNVGGNRMYCWLIQNNFPEGFQVLCFNCNCAKHYFGSCPHVN